MINILKKKKNTYEVFFKSFMCCNGNSCHFFFRLPGISWRKILCCKTTVNHEIKKNFFFLLCPNISNHSPFLREHIFVGLNKFPSRVLVHCHLSSATTGAYSLFKERWDFSSVQCNVSCFKSHPRRLDNIQLIPYTRGLQQNKRWECETLISIKFKPYLSFQLYYF